MEKRHFILILTLTACRLFAQPALPATNQTLTPIANAYSASWIYYTTNPASGLGFLNGASIPYVTATSNSIVTYINTATNGFITAAITNGLASTNFVLSQNYVTSVVTNGLATTNFVLSQGYVTSTVTNGLASISYVNAATNGFVKATITNGLATTNFVIAATNGLVKASITNGLASIAYVNAATNGLVTASITNGLATTNFVLASQLAPAAIWSGVSGNTLSSGSTFYAMPNNSTSTTATGQTNGVTSVPATESITLTNLYVVTSGTVGYGSSHTSTLTIMTNGVASPVTVSITGSSQTTGNDTTHSVTIPAGTTIGVQVVTGSSATAVYWSWSFEGW